MAQLTSFPEWSLSRQNRGPYTRKILIADLPNLNSGAFTDISGLVTQANVNYTMDMASELSFDVVDPDLRMAENNYFTLIRDVIYETQTLGRIEPFDPSVVFVRQLFEIANVTAAQGPGGSPLFSVKCYTKAVQQMKRDRKIASSIKGSGTQFVRNAAKKFGLQFYGQETSKSQQIKASGSKQADSLWDIMKRLADDAKFILFEVDGFLVFGSEEWLLEKWGNNSIVVPRTVTKTKTVKVKIGEKPDPKIDGGRTPLPIYENRTEITKETKNRTVRFISLQFPNSGENYIGRSGVFKLTGYPSITKSDNDPREADGSCTVERINGTQIRPGMTAYVGNIPNMSGYYLIDSVSFNEMSPDPVTVSFRTPKRDEEKYKKKELPVGIKYVQTYADRSIQVTTTQQATQNSAGQSRSKPPQDARIFPLPDASNPYRYPTMVYANLTTAYPAFINDITKGKPGQKSTGDKDSVIYFGTYDLYNRPVLPEGKNGPKTIYSFSITETYGSEFRAIILPSIFTVGGVAVEKTQEEVIAAYEAAGGYEGAGKHLGVVRGTTQENAEKNARDYAKLLSWQQLALLGKRFPNYSGSLQNIPNTAGGSDSVWV